MDKVIYQARNEWGEVVSPLFRYWFDLQGFLLADESLAFQYNQGMVTVVELEIL